MASDFALVEEADMDDAHFEDFTARCNTEKWSQRERVGERLTENAHAERYRQTH